MKGFRNCWPRPVLMLMIILAVLSISCSLSEGRHHHQNHPSAVVVGRVYCDTCFQDDVAKGSHYISGASVAVECKERSTRPAFYQEVKTDNQGTFKVNLPFSISKHVREIEGCNVKLVKSSEPYCAVASTASSSAIHLKAKKRGRHIFSAGFFTFKPLKQPGVCNQQPSVTNSQLNSIQDLLPTPEIPTLPTPNPSAPIVAPNVPLMPNLPTLPNLPPLPQLPPIIGLPGLPATHPFPQIPTEQKEQVEHPQQFSLFPPIVPPVLSPPSSSLPLPPNPLQPAPLLPNPFQPPAAPLIPNPFQPPTPPTSFLPPLPPVPPLPNLPMPLLPNLPIPPLPNLPLPPVPGVAPVPLPSPPPPSLLPPIPFPPLVPGVGLPVPPASVKPKKAAP